MSWNTTATSARRDLVDPVSQKHWHDSRQSMTQQDQDEQSSRLTAAHRSIQQLQVGKHKKVRTQEGGANNVLGKVLLLLTRISTLVRDRNMLLNQHPEE